MHAESPENAIKDKVEMLEAQFQRRFAEFLERLGKEEMSQWLNVDENYKSTVGEAIDFRHLCLNELVKKACQEAAQGDDVTDDQSHLVGREKNLKIGFFLTCPQIGFGFFDSMSCVLSGFFSLHFRRVFVFVFFLFCSIVRFVAFVFPFVEG